MQSVATKVSTAPCRATLQEQRRARERFEGLGAGIFEVIRMEPLPRVLHEIISSLEEKDLFSLDFSLTGTFSPLRFQSLDPPLLGSCDALHSAPDTKIRTRTDGVDGGYDSQGRELLDRNLLEHP